MSHLAIDTLVGFGRSLYAKNTVGPRLWAMVAGTGVAVGWLGLGHLVALTRMPSIGAMYTAYLGTRR